MSEHAQSYSEDRELVPRALIRAMVFLVVAVTALVGFATLTDRPKVGQPPVGEVVAERVISVEVLPRGAAIVFDETGGEVARFDEGEAGFMDAIFRAVSFERQKSGVDADGPVAIARLDTGRHILRDPNSGMVIQLIGYGARNVEPFVALLAEQ